MGVFVTNDKWIKLKGRLDPDDETVMREAAGNSELVIMNVREALEAMKAQEPAKFYSFHKEMERTAGRTLTFEQLVKLGNAADKRFNKFSKLTEFMTRDQAEVVRKLRVEEHCSWRTVARTCYIFGWGKWSPASNQIMGMALCHRAAQLLGQDYMLGPWN